MGFLLFLAGISCFAGFLGGLTGTGGIIMPPLMTELYSVPPHMAMSMAQASYIIPSALAVLLFMRKGQFEWGVALPMAIPGCICSFLAAGYIKPHIDPTLLTVIFALCIMLSGVVMLRKKTRILERPLVPPWRAPILILLGCSVGLMAGVTGSGSNAILVPMMVFFGLPMLAVLAACQFFAVLVSASGTFGNILNMEIDLVAIGWMVVGQTIGMFAGVRLAQTMNTAKLKYCVGVVCFLAGFFILVRDMWLLA